MSKEHNAIVYDLPDSLVAGDRARLVQRSRAISRIAVAAQNPDELGCLPGGSAR